MLPGDGRLPRPSRGPRASRTPRRLAGLAPTTITSPAGRVAAQDNGTPFLCPVHSPSHRRRPHCAARRHQHPRSGRSARKVSRDVAAASGGWITRHCDDHGWRVRTGTQTSVQRSPSHSPRRSTATAGADRAGTPSLRPRQPLPQTALSQPGPSAASSSPGNGGMRNDSEAQWWSPSRACRYRWSRQW